MAADSLKTVDGGLQKTFTVSPLSGLDTVTGGSQVWQSLETAMDDSFNVNDALLNQIGGGPGFRVAFRQLVIGAEAYCTARLAVAEAANGLAEAKLRSKAAAQAVNLTTTYAQQLATNDALYQQLQQAAFGTLLEAKLAVYLELEKYQRAIRYFTLTDSPPPLPDITASVIDFIRTSGEISGYELALEELSPAPQPMTEQTMSFAIADQQRTGDGAIVVQIDLNDPQLTDCARVRIDRIEVSLAGEDGQKIPVSSLHIGSGGTYADRTPNGINKTFTGDPWLKLVKYDPSGAEVVSAGHVLALRRPDVQADTLYDLDDPAHGSDRRTPSEVGDAPADGRSLRHERRTSLIGVETVRDPCLADRSRDRRECRSRDFEGVAEHQSLEGGPCPQTVTRPGQRCRTCKPAQRSFRGCQQV